MVDNHHEDGPRGNGELPCNGYGVSVWKDEKGLGMGVGDCCTTV